MAAPVTAALLVIGDEILSGRTKDKNIGYIAEYLTGIGVDLSEVRVVPDVEAEIVAAVNALRSRYTYVFTTGGIGPTHDDITADAIAKAFGVTIDIDPRAVVNARANARQNGVGALVTVVHAGDLRAPELIKRAPFDLAMANILLRPLQKLAAPVARQLMPNARMVLSGILAAQQNAALAAYRSQGLVLERSFALDGWVTPVMVALSA